MREIQVAIPTAAFYGVADPILTMKMVWATNASDGRYRFNPASYSQGSRVESPGALAVDPGQADLIVFRPRDLSDLVANDSLGPIDEFLEGDDSFGCSNFWPGVFGTVRLRGSTYGIPLYLGIMLTQIYTDVFDRARVELPSHVPGGFGIDDLIAKGRQICDSNTNNDSDDLGFMITAEEANVGEDPTLVFPGIEWFLCAACGGIAHDHSAFGSLEGSAAVRAVDTLRSIVREHRFGVDRKEFVRRAYAGTTGMMFLIWGGRGLPDKRVRLYPFPALESGKNPTCVSLAIGVASGAKDPLMAWEAVQWLHDVYSSAETLPSYLPARRVGTRVLRRLEPRLTTRDAAMIIDRLEQSGATELFSHEAVRLAHAVHHEAVFGSQSSKAALRSGLEEVRALGIR